MTTGASDTSTLLVTGGAGFIGANFVHFWHRRHPGDHIVVLDALTYSGNLANISAELEKPNITFVHGDICDEALAASLFDAHDFDKVVHFAAESHVDRSIAAPDAFVRTNVNGTHSLLKVALTKWKDKFAGRRFHHVSTDEVYGSLAPDDPPFTEASPYDPRSPYAASKAASDFLVRSYGHTYGLPVTISNCSNNYGPYQFPEKVIPLMVINALMGRPLPVYGDGLNVRDWIHVEDHCAVLSTVLERGRAGETYNIGGANEVANIDLVHTLCDLVDARIGRDTELARRFAACAASHDRRCREEIAFVTDRLGHDRRYAIDNSKITREFGSIPTRSLAAGLADTLNWYIDNEEWWRLIQSGEYRAWMAKQYGIAV